MVKSKQILSQNIRKLLSSKNFSQQDLANHINKTRQAINFYLSDKSSSIPLETLEQIAEFFDVEVSDLFKEEINTGTNKNYFSDNSELIEMLKFTIDTLKLNSNLQNSMLETLRKQIDEKEKEIERLQKTIDKLKS
jgi:transcriptional regulator with XRE-family HTH domain